MDEIKAIAELERLQEIVQQKDWMLGYKQSTLTEHEAICDYVDKPWSLPESTVITQKGRRLVSVDPNISASTLSALMLSEASFFKKKEYEHLLTDSTEKIIEQEIAHSSFIGYAHLSQCITANLNQTKADLIATYSCDRRYPFVVGAVIIDALMKKEPLFYYKYVTDEGFFRSVWEPRKVYIRPRAVFPLKTRELKKYYRAPKTLPKEPQNCPACGSKARIFRSGYRGKKYHVCCTKRDCIWFLGSAPKNTEEETLSDWDQICELAKTESERSELNDGGKS